jgi:phosphomevalonate kinase
MLSGEYAVLYGAQAVLVPVPRYMRLEITADATLASQSPVINAARELLVPFLYEHEHEQGVPLVRAVRGDFYAPGTLGQPVKLGLGASAAEAVGVIALRYESAGVAWLSRWQEIARHALTAHHDAQGLGSGADVAAIACGRPLRYLRTDKGFTAEMLPPPAVELRLPLALVWSGQPADTRRLVGRFSAWIDGGGAQADSMLSELIAIANALGDAWFSAPVAELYGLIDDHTALLDRCAAAAGIEYRLPVHTRLAAWAEKHGGRAKPTGAGGGDMILLIGELPLEQLSGMQLIPLDYGSLWPGLESSSGG